MRRNRRFSFLPISLLLALMMVFGAWALLTDARRTDDVYKAKAAVTPEPTMAPPSLAVRPTEMLLRSGTTSLDVLNMQERLKQLGYYTGEADGQFGGGTKEAVTRFQKQHGLDADGMAGPGTLGVLYSDKAQPARPDTQSRLPLLVNASHPLPDDYEPEGLVYLKDEISENLALIKNPALEGAKPAVGALKEMLEAMRSEGLSPVVITDAYRTREQQETLFAQRVKYFTSGEETGFPLSPAAAEKEAEQTAARPGMSEHHTGLAFDLASEEVPFGDSEEFFWLKKHMAAYGFILRYPEGAEDETGFAFEPWHIRFVGAEHALPIFKNDLTLEAYLKSFSPSP